MKKRKLNRNGWLCIIVLGLLIAGGIIAQVQVSGGAAVTQSGAWNVGQTGTWTVQPGNTANTTAWKVDGTGGSFPVTGTVSVNALPTGSNVIGHVIQDSGSITGALPAGTNVIGHVITDSGLINTVQKTACGNSVATGSQLAAIPTSSTLLTSAATACAIAAEFFNTNASAVTVTLTDNTATPINAVLTFSIPGNSNLVQPLYGGAFNLGIKWSASGTGVTGFVVAYQ
jgi:hypothetical protein